MSVMGLKRMDVWMGAGGWGELYPHLFWIFGIFLTLQSPLDKQTNEQSNMFIYNHDTTTSQYNTDNFYDCKILMQPELSGASTAYENLNLFILSKSVTTISNVLAMWCVY